MDYLKLHEKTVLLTGPTSILGRAIACSLAEHGANIALVDKNLDKCEKLAEMIMSQREYSDATGKAKAIFSDNSKPHHVQEATSKAAEMFGSIDVYIDALTYQRHADFGSEIDLDEFERFIDINLRASVHFSHAVLKYMKARERGRVLYLIPDMAHWGGDGEALLSATRSGLSHFAMSLARENVKNNIGVNCLLVGPTDDFAAGTDGVAPERIVDRTEDLPKHLVLSVEEVANAVTFFASPNSSGVTGQTVSVSRYMKSFE